MVVIEPMRTDYKWAAVLGGCFLAVSLCAADKDVIINELMYHPPDERDDLQFVELFNRGTNEVDLSGWSFSKGITFNFPAGTKFPAASYLVIPADPTAFQAHFGRVAGVTGRFTGRLSHGSERVELVNARKEVVDWIKYDDQEGWPLGADGYSASLERIVPWSDDRSPLNWAASALPPRRRTGGTPGKVNDSYSTNMPPNIESVSITPQNPQASQPVTVEASIADTDKISEVWLSHRSILQGAKTEDFRVPMARISGDESKGVYRATIEGRPQGSLTRLQVTARDGVGTLRSFPPTNSPRPTLTYYSGTNTNTARIGFAVVMSTGRAEVQQFGRFGRVLNAVTPGDPTAGNGAFVYVPPAGGAVQVFDHVRLSPRQGGFKVRFLRDQKFKEMSTVNIISEGPPRYLLTEPLAFELYRLAGVPSPLAEHVRVWRDGRWLGYMMMFEQPNKSFLARNQRDTSGNLYKILWFGDGVVGQHEKKTNLRTGHTDVIQIINQLNRTSGEAQWQLIEKNFNVPEFINYYAVNMCIQNWDGFFNNHFVYHDIGGTGKWEVYPWDEDKTWGDYDGASSSYDWYEMPLTFGMNGDRSPGGIARFGQGPFGGVSWWRAPGFFSGPLLANATFRKKFLERLKELCTTVFTEERFMPVINGMENRLEPEVAFWARIHGQSPNAMANLFKSDMDSFRRQLVNRRKFILNELGR